MGMDLGLFSLRAAGSTHVRINVRIEDRITSKVVGFKTNGRSTYPLFWEETAGDRNSPSPFSPTQSVCLSLSPPADGYSRLLGVRQPPAGFSRSCSAVAGLRSGIKRSFSFLTVRFPSRCFSSPHRGTCSLF